MSGSDVSLWRTWCIRMGNWIEAPRQQVFIVAAILFNSATLGLDTLPLIHELYGETLSLIDHIIIGIFVVEIAAKLLHTGRRFFTNPWNVLDLYRRRPGAAVQRGVLRAA